MSGRRHRRNLSNYASCAFRLPGGPARYNLCDLAGAAMIANPQKVSRWLAGALIVVGAST
jgi:hypothetical protein